jgi:hypothetical protein
MNDPTRSRQGEYEDGSGEGRAFGPTRPGTTPLRQPPPPTVPRVENFRIKKLGEEWERCFWFEVERKESAMLESLARHGKITGVEAKMGKLVMSTVVSATAPLEGSGEVVACENPLGYIRPSTAEKRGSQRFHPKLVELTVLAEKHPVVLLGTEDGVVFKAFLKRPRESYDKYADGRNAPMAEFRYGLEPDEKVRAGWGTGTGQWYVEAELPF